MWLAEPVKRSQALPIFSITLQLLQALDSFMVVEREGEIIACAEKSLQSPLHQIATVKGKAIDCWVSELNLRRVCQVSKKLEKTSKNTHNRICFSTREESFLSRVREAVSAYNSNSRLPDTKRQKDSIFLEDPSIT